MFNCLIMLSCAISGMTMFWYEGFSLKRIRQMAIQRIRRLEWVLLVMRQIFFYFILEGGRG